MSKRTALAGAPGVTTEPVPDGLDSGRAWLIAVAGLVANAACWGTMNSFGAFLDSMTDEFDASLGATALIYALPSFVLFMMGVVTGTLADTYGPRRLVAIGAVLSGTGLLATAHASSLPLAIAAYGLGLGLGMACFLVPMTACIGGWFVRRRAVAQGLSAAGAGLGTLVVVPTARWLIDGYGWRRAYEVLALTVFAALMLGAAAASRPPLVGGARAPRPSLSRMRVATSAGPFAAVYLGGFLMTASLVIPLVFLVRYATSHGITKRDAAFLLSILGASNIVSRLVATSLAGRFGPSRVYLACFAVLPAGMGVWLASGSSYAMLTLFAAVVGVSHGGYVALSPEITAELFGVAEMGAVLGALWTGPGIAGLLSPVLAGMAIDHAGYTATICGAAVLALAAVVVQLPLRHATPRR